MDIEVMALLRASDPDAVSLDVLLDLFTFLWEYMTRAMFLPGQIVQWNTIINMGNLSINAMPRELGIGFG